MLLWIQDNFILFFQQRGNLAQPNLNYDSKDLRSYDITRLVEGALSRILFYFLLQLIEILILNLHHGSH